MLTEKDYCDYDTCVALRELGYNYPQRLIIDYFGVFEEPQYDEKIHLYDAQKWLREHGNIDVFPRRGYKKRRSYQVAIYINYNRSIVVLDNDGEDYNSPEDALSEGIKEAVKILKEKYDENI